MRVRLKRELPKGWTELKMVSTGKPDLIGIKARAFLVRMDLVDSTEWITAERLFGWEPSPMDISQNLSTSS